MAETVNADWPIARDAMRELNVSSAYVARLIRDQRIRAVRTKLGYLIDPTSLAAFAAERTARLRERAQ